MQIEFDKIAEYLGELYAAAQHDLKTANPADVGIGGVPVVGWRQAYVEGCKDMVEGVVTRVPDQQREEVKTAVLAAFEAETARLSAETLSP